MSLIDRVKKSLKKIEEELGENDYPDDNWDDNPGDYYHHEVLESFIFYSKKWILAPFMDDIKKGDFEKIPIDCMLSHYILFSRDNHCYYVNLHNNENGNEYEIYDFDWVGEKEEPEFKEITQTMTAIDCAKFLGERIIESYNIYIEDHFVETV